MKNGHQEPLYTWRISLIFLIEVPDLLEVPEVPDGDHDGWSHPHSTGFCLTFSKMYNTWGVKQNMIIRNLPGLGGCP